ncbi:MAG TPA: hypothetical protein VEC35_23220 [Noviherbaspirillum sp.]|nr:hypothetical protein [Noviherbaspirillum sp.]
MHHQPSFALKFSYCLVILGTVVPVGLANSGWVALATGATPMGMIPFLGPILLLALGLYRIYLVWRMKGTLDSPPLSGGIAALRAIGVFCIHLGAVITIAAWSAGPLMRLLIKQQTESGAEFFVVGVYLSLVAGIGLLGFLLFEFSRLVAFERHAREAASLRRG